MLRYGIHFSLWQVLTSSCRGLKETQSTDGMDELLSELSVTAMIDITLGVWTGRQQIHYRLKENDVRSGTMSVSGQEVVVVLTCRRGSEA